MPEKAWTPCCVPLCCAALCCAVAAESADLMECCLGRKGASGHAACGAVAVLCWRWLEGDPGTPGAVWGRCGMVRVARGRVLPSGTACWRVRGGAGSESSERWSGWLEHWGVGRLCRSYTQQNSKRDMKLYHHV